jgi:hypothetical protein
MIYELSQRMDYIESVKIRFPDKQYAEFLHIRNWPNTFRQYIEERKDELLKQREELKSKMQEQIQQVKERILKFKETISEVKLVGLVEAQLEYDDEEESELDEDSQGNPIEPTDEQKAAKELEKRLKEESAEGKTFSWLIDEVKMFGRGFDKELIAETFAKIEGLKKDYDEADRDCGLINKREALLGNKKTDFMDLAKIQDELKPLYALWTVASSFAVTLPRWIEGRFGLLDAGQIEGQVDDWLNELKRLAKTDFVNGNAAQKEMHQFMFDGLTHFKMYGPMLRTLRTKGLSARHWRMIAEQLEV